MVVFEDFPEGIMISEYARIRILTSRVRWKQPRVGQIWPQIEKLVFLDIWDAAWRISMATIRRGTFMCQRVILEHHWHILESGVSIDTLPRHRQRHVKDIFGIVVQLAFYEMFSMRQ